MPRRKKRKSPVRASQALRLARVSELKKPFAPSAWARSTLCWSPALKAIKFSLCKVPNILTA